MTRQFDGATCVLCRKRPSSPTGEHVWPQWFLKAFPEDDGPYKTEVNGRPVMKRDGKTPRSQTSLSRIKLPCCAPCNNVLNKRFEHNAQPVIERLMTNDNTVVLTSVEAHIVGIWLLKTMLLLAHPAARSSEPGIALHQWDLAHVPDDLYSWMIGDQPPSSGLSVWIAKWRNTKGNDDTQSRHCINLPTVVTDDRTTAFKVKRVAIRLLEITLVYHPGWPIEHPLETNGTAVRIWPRAGVGQVNLATLSPVNPWAISWLTGPELHFAPGTFGNVILPPLTSGLNPAFQLLPWVVFARM